MFLFYSRSLALSRSLSLSLALALSFSLHLSLSLSQSFSLHLSLSLSLSLSLKLSLSIFLSLSFSLSQSLSLSLSFFLSQSLSLSLSLSPSPQSKFRTRLISGIWLRCSNVCIGWFDLGLNMKNFLQSTPPYYFCSSCICWLQLQPLVTKNKSGPSWKFTEIYLISQAFSI